MYPKSILLIATLIMLIAFVVGKNLATKEAYGIIYAKGGIEVTFDQNGWPFMETDFYPGDIAIKLVTVRNNTSRKQMVLMKTTARSKDGWVLPLALLLRIRDVKTGANIYGGEVGLPLIATYLNPSDLYLFDLAPAGVKGDSKDLEVRVKFAEIAGNLFQKKSTKFNFTLGFIPRLFPR